MGCMCEHCGKECKYRRNLIRHMKEHHSDREHWICVVKTCDSTFIRRSYLAKHLVLCHGLDPVTSRECAINAQRGDHQDKAYYENESEDDSIFDLIAEANGTLYYPADYHFVSDFNTDQFKTYPNVVVGARNACDKVYVHNGACGDTNCDSKRSVYNNNSVNDDEPVG